MSTGRKLLQRNEPHSFACSPSVSPLDAAKANLAAYAAATRRILPPDAVTGLLAAFAAGGEARPEAIITFARIPSGY
jgi:hypothetical protein